MRKVCYLSEVKPKNSILFSLQHSATQQLSHSVSNVTLVVFIARLLHKGTMNYDYLPHLFLNMVWLVSYRITKAVR